MTNEQIGQKGNPVDKLWNIILEKRREGIEITKAHLSMLMPSVIAFIAENILYEETEKLSDDLYFRRVEILAFWRRWIDIELCKLGDKLIFPSHKIQPTNHD